MSQQDKVKVTNSKKLPKYQILKFHNKLYMQHTFWSCLIRCANMKWIWQVLWKIQSGKKLSTDRQMDRRTDRQTDGRCETSIPPFNFVEAGGIKISGELCRQAYCRQHILVSVLSCFKSPIMHPAWPRVTWNIARHSLTNLGSGIQPWLRTWQLSYRAHILSTEYRDRFFFQRTQEINS